MDAFLRDVTHAARMFMRSHGFTIAAIGTLTLGIASNTAIFSVVNTVLLKPFEYHDPQRIVMFQIVYKGGFYSAFPAAGPPSWAASFRSSTRDSGWQGE